MKKAILILALALASVTAFSQSKKAKTPDAKAPEHTYVINDEQLQVLIGSTAAGIDQFLHTTSIPANQIAQYKASFARFLEVMSNRQLAYDAADKAFADSVSKVKAHQDSLIKAKPKN